MGEIGEFSRSLRLFLRAYRWRKIDPVPWAPLDKPLAECRLAVVSSAGQVPADQEAFDDKMRGGDPSFRAVPADTDPGSLVDSHRSEAFDHSGMVADPNLGFPINRAQELVDRGRVASVAPRHLSFMGSITAPGRLVKHYLPEAASLLVEDGVDVALLVPV